MARREGDTHAAKLLREETVYKLILCGLTPREIAGQMHVSVRTIQTDYRQTKIRLLQTVQAEELRSLKLALAELDMLWREGCSLLFRPPRDGKDDRMGKLAALSMLLHIIVEKNRLILSGAQPRTMGGQTITRPEMLDGEARTTILAEMTNQMPAELRNGIIAWVRKKEGLQSEPETTQP